MNNLALVSIPNTYLGQNQLQTAKQACFVIAQAFCESLHLFYKSQPRWLVIIGDNHPQSLRSEMKVS